jgi:hypothetical protein
MTELHEVKDLMLLQRAIKPFDISAYRDIIESEGQEISYHFHMLYQKKLKSQANNQSYIAGEQVSPVP